MISEKKIEFYNQGYWILDTISTQLRLEKRRGYLIVFFISNVLSLDNEHYNYKNCLS